MERVKDEEGEDDGCERPEGTVEVGGRVQVGRDVMARLVRKEGGDTSLKDLGREISMYHTGEFPWMLTVLVSTSKYFW